MCGRDGVKLDTLQHSMKKPVKSQFGRMTLRVTAAIRKSGTRTIKEIRFRCKGGEMVALLVKMDGLQVKLC